MESHLPDVHRHPFFNSASQVEFYDEFPIGCLTAHGTEVVNLAHYFTLPSDENLIILRNREFHRDVHIFGRDHN